MAFKIKLPISLCSPDKGSITPTFIVSLKLASSSILFVWLGVFTIFSFLLSKVSKTLEVFLSTFNSLFLEFDPLANFDDSSCETVRVEGCTSQIADNYNPLANDDIGTCTFNDVMTQLSLVNDSLIILNDLVINCATNLEPIYIDLASGWNTIGFTLRNPQNPQESYCTCRLTLRKTIL